MKRTLFLLGVAAFAVWGVWLLCTRTAAWAARHPLPAVALAAVALPVLFVLVRGMPRVRDLRRAARAGAATCRTPVPDAAAVAEPVLPQEAASAPESGVEAFLALDADGFEQAVARLCERDGCSAVSVVGGAGDLGADVLAVAPGGRRVVIQCKRYGEAHKVGSQDVQRFGGTCFTVHGADVAAVVTTSAFTAPAADYAQAAGIRCVDDVSLAAWADGTGAPPWA